MRLPLTRNHVREIWVEEQEGWLTEAGEGGQDGGGGGGGDDDGDTSGGTHDEGEEQKGEGGLLLLPWPICNVRILTGNAVFVSIARPLSLAFTFCHWSVATVTCIALSHESCEPSCFPS